MANELIKASKLILLVVILGLLQHGPLTQSMVARYLRHFITVFQLRHLL